MNDPGVATFINEARELLSEMETALLACEQGQHTPETINALFRAAHTIKGSSGLFGLDVIVAFTHVVESALDRVREGEIALDAPLAAVLLECKDHIEQLVSAIGDGAVRHDPKLKVRGDALIVKLHDACERKPAAPSAATSRDCVGCGSDAWHISVRFSPEVLRNGMDPLSFLRYLTTFGELLAVELVDDHLPAPAEMDPQTCYLGFEMRYRSSVDRAQIEGAFEFVRDDCTLRIVPPRAQLSEYVRLLNELPPTETRLGDMLVRCGSLTPHELERALQAQQAAADGADEAPRLGHILIEEQVVHPAVVDAALTKQREVREQKGAPGAERQSIRVDADKLEKLINLVGELIIAGASTQLIARGAGLAALNESTSKLSRLVEEIRDQALQLRMVQIGATFNRFQRIVRDVAKELGKNIRLEVSGAETELDKTLIEQINDPLMHLVRNAIDHGVEDATTRAARGKSPEGVVRLNAYHDSGAVVIEVSDDGGGLDREKILNKALERGVITDGQTLSDREVYALIFEPGFSTAEQVTNLSGRGVGMDVVRRNVSALRGSVDVDSRPGAGTTVRVRLPLTLAIIDGFLVRVGRSALVIPLALVEECVELTDVEQSRAGGHHFIDLRGVALPYIRLREAFNLSGASTRRESIVVVRDAGRRVGLVVDELLGELQTVIKPLSKLFKRVQGVGGSTILGSGEVALILDIPSLVQSTTQIETEEAVNLR